MPPLSPIGYSVKTWSLSPYPTRFGQVEREPEPMLRIPSPAQRSDILHVEILQQILVDDGFDCAGRGCGSPWRGAAVNQDVQAAQLLCRLGDHAVHLLLVVTSAARGTMRRFVSAANSRAVASR